MGISCTPAFHRHQQTCAKCGVSDDSRGPIAATVTRDGRAWPSTCATCSGKVEKRQRILAIERAVA